ncbi:ATP-binding cassette domain-containing protein [Catalinimonas niigatensis]|uniref:ATP-binding cassette domain-containing protein n=1 Tax=Catalinimonas niigatensis TaxID=1397264 RepID=UPI002666D2E7|nr:ATP-binding cassette domain-containing protein [Catalinimonas niigatensis]WPP52949.1 ATP-binding cassette domain-containing protein [Catalinimonas niigatensis]
MSLAIRTDNLIFNYGNQTNIHDLSLFIPEGSCFGLLGRNGAGKSTIMKLILGLLKAQQGKVFLFEQELQQRESKVFDEIGALVEDPPLYTHLSAQDNLMISVLYRNLQSKRIAEVLDMVGLSSNVRQKVGTFSTGMKQRLGIALALLPDPQLLILDEPVNGLDPEGIVAIRKLIQHLHQEEGKTLLLSSHLLHEVELSCDHIGILHQGKLLYQGTLKALHQEKHSSHPLWIETDQTQKAVYLLQQSSFQVESEGEKLLVHLQTKEQIAGLIDLLRANAISIFQIRQPDVNLEDLYLHFTQLEKSANEET